MLDLVRKLRDPHSIQWLPFRKEGCIWVREFFHFSLLYRLFKKLLRRLWLWQLHVWTQCVTCSPLHYFYCPQWSGNWGSFPLEEKIDILTRRNHKRIRDASGYGWDVRVGWLFRIDELLRVSGSIRSSSSASSDTCSNSSLLRKKSGRLQVFKVGVAALSSPCRRYRDLVDCPAVHDGGKHRY